VNYKTDLKAEGVPEETSSQDLTIDDEAPAHICTGAGCYELDADDIAHHLGPELPSHAGEDHGRWSRQLSRSQSVNLLAAARRGSRHAQRLLNLRNALAFRRAVSRTRRARGSNHAVRRARAQRRAQRAVGPPAGASDPPAPALADGCREGGS
jgi:hypothetical protein